MRIDAFARMIKAKGATMEKQYEIGNLITELRKEKKLTQSKLAEALGVTDKSVSKWENGKSLPDTKIMPRLCEILGISLEELLNGKLNPITESPVLDDLQRLEHVYKYYSDEHRVNIGISDINLALNLGERVAITGPSGSGKTTLLKMIGGIDRFERGEIFIRKEGISRFDEEDYELYRKDFIAYIFQEYGVFENYSLLDNLILVRLLMGDAHKEAKAKALAMLEKVGFAKFAGKKASKLSGGQKQKLAVARALLKDSPIILGDEITSSLDKKSAKEVLRLLFANANGKLVVLVTHHFEEVEEFCTRRISMADGAVVGDEIIEITPRAPIMPPQIHRSANRPNPFRAFGTLWRNRAGLVFGLSLLCLIPASAIIAANVGMDYAYRETSRQPTEHLFAENELYVRKKEGFSDEEMRQIASMAERTFIASPHAAPGFSYVADPSVSPGVRYCTNKDSVFGQSFPVPLAVTFAETRLSEKGETYRERISIEDYIALAPVFSYFGKRTEQTTVLKYVIGENEVTSNVFCFNFRIDDKSDAVYVNHDFASMASRFLSLTFPDGSVTGNIIVLEGKDAGLPASYVGFTKVHLSHFRSSVTEMNLLCPAGKKEAMKSALRDAGYVVLASEDELGGIKGNDVLFLNEVLFSLFSVILTVILIPLTRRFSSLVYKGQRPEMVLWRRIGFSGRDVSSSFVALQMVPMLAIYCIYLTTFWIVGFVSPALLTLSFIELGLMAYFLWNGDIKAIRKAMEE